MLYQSFIIRGDSVFSSFRLQINSHILKCWWIVVPWGSRGSFIACSTQDILTWSTSLNINIDNWDSRSSLCHYFQEHLDPLRRVLNVCWIKGLQITQRLHVHMVSNIQMISPYSEWDTILIMMFKQVAHRVFNLYSQSCQLSRFRRVTHAFACFHTLSRHTSNLSRPKKIWFRSETRSFLFKLPDDRWR